MAMRRVLYLRVPHLQTTLERQWDPSLAERPVVVVAPLTTNRRAAERKTRVVLDASPEAEAEGVLAGLTERHARRRCPEGVFLAVERARYEPSAEMIGDLLATETPWVERREIAMTGVSRRGRARLRAQEEFFADLGRGDGEEGLSIARRVAERLAAELGLPARITLATGRFVAKTLPNPPAPFPSGKGAGGLGPYLLPEGRERAVLRPLPIEALWEAPAETRRRMELLGLRTLGQLAAVPQRWLVELFGPVGRWYGLLARGIDPRGVRAWNPAPAVTATAELPSMEADRALLAVYLQRLAEEIAAWLVREGSYARRATLILTLENGHRLHATRSLKEPTNLARALARAGGELLERVDPSPLRGGGRGERSITLSVSELESHGALQLAIFGDGERGPALRAAVARLQERFGEEVIRTAAGLTR
jgi:DNA polymerase-4